MIILEPSVSLYECGDDLEAHIARCASVCYDSSPKDNKRLCEHLWRSGHRSMFRHITRYYMIPPGKEHVISKLSPFTHVVMHYAYAGSPASRTYVNDVPVFVAYVASNGQAYEENDKEYLCEEWRIPAEKAPESIRRYTIECVTSIDISRELNRVSPNAIAESSTRLIIYGTKKRPDLPILKTVFADEDPERWEDSLRKFKIDEEYYFSLLKKGYPVDYARKHLPLGTATKVVYTYTRREWDEIFRKRVDGETGEPHADAKDVMTKARDLLDKQ